MLKKVLLTLSVLLALILLVIPVSAASEDISEVYIDGTEDYDEIQQILLLVNEARAEEGLNPLTLDNTLVDYAMQRAAENVIYYDHTRPDGTRCFSILEGVFLYGAAGENIAAGYRSAADVMNGWMNSQGHRENILRSNYNSIGIGCFYQDGTMYWVQLFSSLTSKDVCTTTGTQFVQNVPINVCSAYFSWDIGSTNTEPLRTYAGNSMPFQVTLENLGWYYGDPAILSGGYTIASSNTKIAKPVLDTAGHYTLTCSSSGTATITVKTTNQLHTTSVDINVVPRPVISGSYNDYGYFTLTWNDDAFQTAMFYKENNSDVWTRLCYSGTNSCVHYGFDPNKSYSYILRAYINGEYIDVSDIYSVGAPLAPVVTASNIAASGKVKLSWPAVSGATKYQVYRSTSKNGTYKLLNTVTTTTYQNLSVSAGSKYYYKVKAVDAAGNSSEFSNIVSIVVDLARPSVTASNIADSGKVQLKWGAVDGATGYEIWRSTSKNGSYTKLNTVTTTSYKNLSVSAGQSYYYKVRAICKNSDATSVCSVPVYITVDLARPSVTASNIADSGKVQLKWNAVDGATGYEIWRSTSKNGSYTKLNTVTSTSYKNLSVSAGQSYYYKVRAICKNSAATSVCSVPVYITVDLERPNVTISLTSAGNPLLSWDAVPGAAGYEIWRSTKKDGSYTKLRAVSGTVCSDSTATAGQVYYYRVRAIHKNSSAHSALSTVDSITAVLSAPNVKISVTSAGNPLLSWNSVSGAAKYTIYRSTSKNGTYTKYRTVSGTACSDASVTEGVVYYYKVVAVCKNTAGNSRYSNIVEIKIK